jgi:hypothetical protein
MVFGTLPVANGGTSIGTGSVVLSPSGPILLPMSVSCTGEYILLGVTGTLPVAYGGPGLTSGAYTNEQILIGNTDRNKQRKP